MAVNTVRACFAYVSKIVPTRASWVIDSSYVIRFKNSNKKTSIKPS